MQNLLLGLLIGFAASAQTTTGVAGENAATTVSYSLGIKGMTCETCSAHARKQVAAVPGVVKATVDYKTGRAWVVLRKPIISGDRQKPRQFGVELAAAVKKAGYQPTVHYVLSIKGMTCEACSKHVANAVRKVPGVVAASVNYKGGYAVVVPSAKSGRLSGKLIAVIEKAGYRAVVNSGP